MSCKVTLPSSQFQNFNLLAPLTAEKNVMMPLQLQGVSKPEARDRTKQTLKTVGTTDCRRNLPK